MTHEQLTMILHALVRARDGFGSERATGLPVTDSWREEALTKISQAIAVAADARAALAAPPAEPPVPADVLRDALRYRWLKDANALVDDLANWPHIVMAAGQWDAPIFAAEADAAVDTAIAAAPLAAAQPVPATGAQPKE